MYWKMREHTLFFMLVVSIANQCIRERCCLVSTCSLAYCIQKNSQTWISTLDYTDYQYTKLTLSSNDCLPCPYNCKTCTTTSTCTQCLAGYYMNTNNNCQVCGYKCNICTVINSITKCSSCQDGTYLDTNSLSCQSCPTGAKTCANANTIIQCESGYLKSSNSLYCTQCPTNCAYCPISDTFCSSCQVGYYLSGGACYQCTVSNCDGCIRVGVTQYCTACSSRFYLNAGTCFGCTSNCLVCNGGTCTQCQTGYYLSSGSCASVTQTITNCNIYSSSTTCSSCVTGYYYNSGCLPCSLLCTECEGGHFGRCTTCASTATLFNQMCIVDAFPSISKVMRYVGLPGSLNDFAGGSLFCVNLYQGTTISIELNDLSAYKIDVNIRVYTATASQSYTLTMNSNTHTLQSTTTQYSLCSSSLYISDNTITFADITINNTLTISSSSNVYLSQMVITIYKCNDLCLECSQTQCFTCLTSNLYTQDAYCVYSCSQGYYTYRANKQCVTTCPTGTYPMLADTTCEVCVSPCLTCTSSVACLTCISNYFLTPSSTCSQTCPDEYYPSTKTQNCEECVGRCRTCTSETACLTCKVGFLEVTECVDSCGNSSLYADLSTLQCQSCDASCATCEFSSTFCLSCPSNLYFFNNSCLSQCPNQYYKNSPNCDSCAYPCENCENSSTTCTSCWDKYLLNGQCLSSCPDGYYEDNLLLQCAQCGTGCTICYGLATSCLGCASGYYLYGSSCLTTCPDEFYPNAQDNLCEKCVDLCLTCSSRTTCLSCNANFYSSGQCVRSSECSSGYYADISTLTCKQCHSSCLTCQFDSTRCTSCANGSYLYENGCQSSCPSTYYYTSGTSCLLCEQPCLTCRSQTQCLSCVAGYKYSASNYVCSSTCSVGTYFNASINDCSVCSSSCLMCDSGSFCHLCADAYYLYVLSTTTNECRNQCPDGYYADNLVCQACLYPCATCTSSIDCVSCVLGIQYQNRCISGCPESTFLINNTCSSCGGNCLTCENTSTTCLSCVSNYFLQGITCVTQCSVGTYGFSITQSCLTCPSTCSECTNSTYCTNCIANQTYLDGNNSCVEFCATGMYGDDGTGQCQSCETKCYTCSGTSSNCLSCASGYLLVRLQNAEFDCLTSCPSLYYNDNSICYVCIFPCGECTSTIACTTCAAGTYFHSSSSSCLLSCPIGTFSQTSPTNQCVDCTSPCQTCTAANYCVSCLNNLKLYQGTCVSSCPSQYYGDNSGICNRCYGLCETCTGKYYCLTCHAGYAYEGFCYSVCPAGTFAEQTSKTCQGCTSPCLECSLVTSYCTRCLFNMYAYRGQCSATCPTGTYPDNDECLTCLFPCVNCNSQFACNECLGGYLLYMRSSCIDNVDKCPNDLYKMDSKECVPMTWCPSTYYKDETLKVCSSACSRQKYIDQTNKLCIDACLTTEYVSEGMVCTSWSIQPPSLMAMSAISFIKSSQVYIVISFNESISWSENSESLYTFTINSRRLLITSTVSYHQLSQQLLKLRVASLPHSGTLYLPAHYLVSSVTNYPLQNPTITVELPDFTVYSYNQIYTGSVMGQFSKGVSWFILLFSLFFLFMNRLSDLYVLWDTVQLLYLLLFLNIQYPPNVNEFLLGMQNTHFLFLPSLFGSLVSETVRDVSDPPFYAYTFDNSFFRTAGKPLLLALIVGVIFILLKIGQTIIKKCQCAAEKAKTYPGVKKFVFKGILRYRWHHTSDIFFLTYDIIMLFAVAELSHAGQNPNNAGSNVLCGICILVYVLFPIFVGYKLYKHYPNISKGKMVANLKCFYRGIERESKFGVALILVRYVRKLLYCIIIGVFSTEPMFALPILMFSSVLMGLFLFVNMPYKKRLSNIITIGTQIVLVLFCIIVALIKFQSSEFSADVNYILGWVCCFLLVVMIFALIYEVFCKTMFYLEPQTRGGKTGQLSQEFIRKKAGEFFDHIFPKIRDYLNLDDSEDELKPDYEEGDSDNSENNQLRAQRWDIEESEHQDEFRHYGADSESDKTEAKPDEEKNPPQFLIRCVKEFDE